LCAPIGVGECCNAYDWIRDQLAELCDGSTAATVLVTANRTQQA